MKTKSFLAAFLALFISFRSGALPAAAEKLAGADNTFAFNLLKQVAGEQPDSNIFISPYSASTVLQMVAEGAAGQTKTEMQDVLGTSGADTGLSDAARNQANREIAQSLHRENSHVILEIANAIWFREGYRVKHDFITCNRDYFDATVAPLDFADPHCVDVINHWASEKTHGRITHIADGMIDPEYSRLFLANAVYFKGKWADAFDPGRTHDWPFYLQNGSQKLVSMMMKSKMTKSETFMYLQGAEFQAVRLPYQGGSLAMYIFLPAPGSSPEKLLASMTGDAWQRSIKPDFSAEDGMLMLPKFKLEDNVGLRQPLKEMGMATAFDQEKADFSGISSNDLYISAALQKTWVEVDEEGTEAAAVTGMTAATLGIPEGTPERFEMIVDRPFLFLIEDHHTGTILFMGVIYDPPTDN